MYKISLAMSVTLNVILIGAFLFASERQSTPGDLPSPGPRSSLLQPRVTSEPEKIHKPADANPSRSVTAPPWQQSIQQLRDAGVPHTVVAQLVIADFELRWQKQLREFEQRYQSGAVDDDERARFEARRDDEQEKELRFALGDEGFRQWDKENTLRDLDLAKLRLSASETDALYQLRKERDSKDRTLAEAWRNAEIDEADYNKQQSVVQQEYDQQFELLLGDERYRALQDFEAGTAPDQEDSPGPGTDSRRLLKRYANTWSLSETDIDYIDSSIRHYRERTRQARNQVEQALGAYLGPERFDRLKKNGLF
ncbi:MAG: hypothetical protein ABW171_00665, partial [Steroidobacter sp.]